ncbi:MAG: prepilin-type N-terminal cleavage/methylation domain-containing protein [Steroidobacteraceae bacterium]
MGPLRRQARGVSLVELLVSTAVGTVAIAAALVLMQQGRRAQLEADAVARLADIAASAADVLAAEVRVAGYLGRLPPGSAVIGATPFGLPAPEGLSDATECGPSLALDLSRPLAAADGAMAAASGAPLSCRASPAGRWQAGTDTLLIRRASLQATHPTAGRLQMATTRELAHLMSDGRNLLGPEAAVHDLVADVYYISRDATGEPGMPSLRRKRLVGGTRPRYRDEELFPGVADLQVEGLQDAQWQPLGALDVAQVETIRLRLEVTDARGRRSRAERTVVPRNLGVWP